MSGLWPPQSLMKRDATCPLTSPYILAPSP